MTGAIWLLVSALVLSACGGVVTPAATPVPPTQAPQATQASVATAAPTQAAKTPADVRVAVVPGGPHPYFLPMEPGLADAVKAFGLGQSEFKSPPEWTLAAQNQLITSMVAQGYNAFGIFPGDANATNGTIDELVAKGIPVLALAGCVNEPTKATFCLATDVGQSAYLGTQALIKAMGGKGKIIHGTGFLVDPNTQKRIKAVEKAVAETNGAVTLVQVLADIDSQEAADKAINSFLAAHGSEIDGIITSAYVPSTVAATALRNLGDKRIKMVGIDDDPIVLDAIKDGYLVGTMAQNPYGQAYIGAMVLGYLSTGCTRKADAPNYVDSGTLLISQDNLTTYKDDLKVLTKEIGSGFQGKYLDCPAGVGATTTGTGTTTTVSMANVRVAVVPGGPHPYFLPMEPGLADAVKAFGLGQSEFKSPPEWTLAAQNQLITSMV
nr:substrate-binding domain-containing protein [Chloroflexota bacterium]